MSDLDFSKLNLDVLKKLQDEVIERELKENARKEFDNIITTSNDENLKLLVKEGIINEILLDNPSLKDMGKQGLDLALGMSKRYIDIKINEKQNVTNNVDMKIQNNTNVSAASSIESDDVIEDAEGKINWNAMEKDIAFGDIGYMRNLFSKK